MDAKALKALVVCNCAYFHIKLYKLYNYCPMLHSKKVQDVPAPKQSLTVQEIDRELRREAPTTQSVLVSRSDGLKYFRFIRLLSGCVATALQNILRLG